MAGLHVDVQVVHACGVKKTSYWCSLAFRKALLAGQAQIKLKEPCPVYNFAKLVKDTPPGYDELMPYEYGIACLIKDFVGCFDLAYLTAVWRYWHKAGRKHFPMCISSGQLRRQATWQARHHARRK